MADGNQENKKLFTWGKGGETPEVIRKSYGITKDSSELYWSNANVQNYYKKGGTLWNPSKIPKIKQELALACELPQKLLAWSIGEVNHETKFINTTGIGYSNLETLAHTAESPDVQLQMLRESGRGFQELVMKMSQNPNLSDRAVEYITNKFIELFNQNSSHIETEPFDLYKKLLETENPNKDLVKKLSKYVVENYNLISYIGGIDVFISNKHISPEIVALSKI